MAAAPAPDAQLLRRALGTLYDNGQRPHPDGRQNGTLVAGIIDIRGQVTINGTILTTYQPQSEASPRCVGTESPNYELHPRLHVRLRPAATMEEELPTTGMGKIQIHYDPTRPLPDGILSAHPAHERDRRPPILKAAP